jgi:hypothetical protein
MHAKVHIPVMRKGKANRADHRKDPKGQTPMKTLFAQYRAELAKRAAFRRTRDEIAHLPRSMALDLGIFPEDADQIAREAVWG